MVGEQLGLKVGNEAQRGRLAQESGVDTPGSRQTTWRWATAVTGRTLTPKFSLYLSVVLTVL